MNIQNAKIESTMLGYEGHGIITAFITLDYGGAGQVFGGYRLESTMYEWVKQVIDIVGVTRWEDLKGKYIRVESDNGKITRIGHLMEDKWFSGVVDITY
jgi:hypothetical protein